MRKPFTTSEDTQKVREDVHSNAVVCSDVLGPITPASESGYKYLVTFIIMKNRYVSVYPLRKKSDISGTLISFYQDAWTTAGVKFKVLRSDKAVNTATRQPKLSAR